MPVGISSTGKLKMTSRGVYKIGMEHMLRPILISNYFFLNTFSLVYYLGDKETHIASLINKYETAYDARARSSKEELIWQKYIS